MVSLTSRWRPALALLAAGAIVAGCAGSEQDSEPADGAGATAFEASPAAPQAPAPRIAPQQAPVPQQGPQRAPSPRKEVTTGTVRVIANDPVGAARTLVVTVNGLGGRVDARTEQPEPVEPEGVRGIPGKGARATLTVRVPADRTEQLLTELRGAGRITSVTINKEDVTLKNDDMDARIRALQAAVDRLRALIVSAASVSDLISAENALSARQGELDGLLAQKRTLDDQVALSTLSITFTQDGRGPVVDDDSFWDGVKSGWRSLRNAVSDTVVALGVALPWVVFAGLIVAALWAGLRAAWRRRRRGAGAQPEPADAVSDDDPAESSSKPGAESAPVAEPGTGSGSQ